MKTKTVSQLKKKLWPPFATYIKRRDKLTCVTCNTYCGKSCNAGHYIAKGACGAEYYFSEQNVNCQCVRCNLSLEGNRPAYRAYIIKKYGEAVLHDIENNYHRPCTNYPYEEKIAHYQSLL